MAAINDFLNPKSSASSNINKLKFYFCNSGSCVSNSYHSAGCHLNVEMRFFRNNLRFKTEPFILHTQSVRFKAEPFILHTKSLRLSPKTVIQSEPSRLSALLKTSDGDRYTKENSSIMVIGFNHHTAPIDIREKLYIPEQQWPQAIGQLCDLIHIQEAAVLSTCNRMEIYVVVLSKKRGIKEVIKWMSKMSSVPVSELCKHRFLLSDKDAVRHLFEVSSGLDSLVLGEGQILSQVKQVVKTGQGVRGFDRKITGLFKHAITAGKRVRTETRISTGSVSVSSAAVELAMTKLPESSRVSARMLVVGAGKMGKLVVKHLAAKGCRKIVVVNRTEGKVASLRNELTNVEIVYEPFSEILTCAAESDVIFTCTAIKTLLFTKDEVQMLSPVGPHVGGQRLFVDISVPRNVGACVSEIESVKVYNVDDLKDVVAANKVDRMLKVVDAKVIIEEEVNEFEAWKDSLQTVPTIKKLRAYAERIRASEVEKCLSKMGDDATSNGKKAIYDLSLGIVNKLLHGPMHHLRCDSTEKRYLSEILDNMHSLTRMFNLDTEMS